jgi:hypothetical protein
VGSRTAVTIRGEGISVLSATSPDDLLARPR